MIKVKHARTADCVVAGFRWHKSGNDTVGSLLLGLYDDRGVLHHVGVTSSFTMAMRKQLAGSWRRCARTRSTNTRGANGPARTTTKRPHARRAEPLERRQGSVVGAAADRAGLRGQVRPSAGRPLSPRGDLPAVAAGQTPPSDCRYDQLEVTTPLTSSRRFSGRVGSADRGCGSGLRTTFRRWLIVGSGLIVRIERLLNRPQLDRNMLEIDAHAGPRGRPAAHRIDEHVGGREVRGRVGMTGLPALQPGERILLALRAADLDQRMLRGTPAGRLHARRLAGLLLVLRRPRRVTETVALLPRRQLEQARKRTRMPDRWPRAGRRAGRSAPAWSRA